MLQGFEPKQGAADFYQVFLHTHCKSGKQKQILKSFILIIQKSIHHNKLKKKKEENGDKQLKIQA